MAKRRLKHKQRAGDLEFWMPEFLRDGAVDHTQWRDEAPGPYSKFQRAGWGSMGWESEEVWGVVEATPLNIRIAWDIAKSEIMAEWIREKPGSRPWAFWKFADPQRPAGQTELSYLKSNGLLTRAEKVLLNKGVI